jgi:hypothetical protein
MIILWQPVKRHSESGGEEHAGTHAIRHGEWAEE